jgi:hypothetical protein
MSEPKLINQFAVLDQEALIKKIKLADKILPLIQEFTRETGLLVRSIEPGYTEVTAMGNDLREFLIISIKVYTDVDVRGLSNRKVGQ